MILQLNHPDKVDGLILIDCTAKQAGWVEWGYQKVCALSCRDLGIYNAYSLAKPDSLRISGEGTPAIYI